MDRAVQVRRSSEATPSHSGSVPAVLRSTLVSALVLLAVAPATSRAAAPAAFGGPTGRRALDGDWYVRLDAGDSGARRGWAAGRFAGRRVRLPYAPNARNLSADSSYQGSV